MRCACGSGRPALRPRQHLLGRRQVVRHRFLVPAFAGSNPAAPANSIFMIRPLNNDLGANRTSREVDPTGLHPPDPTPVLYGFVYRFHRLPSPQGAVQQANSPIPAAIAAWVYVPILPSLSSAHLTITSAVQSADRSASMNSARPRIGAPVSGCRLHGCVSPLSVVASRRRPPRCRRGEVRRRFGPDESEVERRAHASVAAEVAREVTLHGLGIALVLCTQKAVSSRQVFAVPTARS